MSVVAREPGDASTRLPARREPQDRDDLPAAGALVSARAGCQAGGLPPACQLQRPLPGVTGPARAGRPAAPAQVRGHVGASGRGLRRLAGNGAGVARAAGRRERRPGAAGDSSFGTDVEVHVVLTARDLLRQLSAEWQEHVKHRSTLRFDEFVASVREQAPSRSGWFWRVQDYVGLANRWGEGLPPSRVHVVTVPPAGAPQGLLWRRFAGLLGLEPDSFDTSTSRANTSLGLEQAELLRRVNVALGDRLALPGPYPVVVKQVLAHKVLAGRPGSPAAARRSRHRVRRRAVRAPRKRAGGGRGGRRGFARRAGPR